MPRANFFRYSLFREGGYSPAGQEIVDDAILDYFNDANKNKQHKRFDFSVIGGPHYASDTKFGLGMVAAGLYRTDP